MTLRRTTEPTSEPLTLDEVKLHLRVDHGDEDGLIAGLIAAARVDCEKRLQRTLMSSVWTLSVDCFAELDVLRMPPIVEVASVNYVTVAGESRVMDPDAYQVDTASEPGRIRAASSWPAAADRFNAVSVVYSAGYPDADAIPAPVKQWMLLAIGDMYANREASVAKDFPDWLLDPHKIVGC